MKRFISYFLSTLLVLALFLFVFSFGYLSNQYPIFRHGSAFLAGALVCRSLRRRYSQRSKVLPPLAAQFLFYYFLDAQNCDALVGDLEERYRIIRKKFGTGRANFWYWSQAIRSVGPIVWAWGKKVALKPVIGVVAWAVARGLVDHDSWLVALVEMWKRIRS